MFRSGSVNSKNQSRDRFIPQRMRVNLNLFNQESSAVQFETDVHIEEEFVNYARIRYNRHYYQTALKNILLPLETKVLNFFPPKKVDLERRPALVVNESWPVKARKKPVIGPPETVLDMPQFDSNICHHVADWSSKNCLATIFENEVHMWYPDSEFLKGTTDTRKRVQNCVKWRSCGTQFAMGLVPRKIGIWDIIARKVTCESCCCLDCDIHCMAWISDNLLVTGCSNGALEIFNSNLKHVKKEYACQSSIINIEVSCNKTFIAISSMDKRVIVWKVPELEGHFQIRFTTIVRAIAWHPWRNSLLALGHGYNWGYIVLWNVNTQKEIARESSTYKDSSVDCLTFNPISGELVASYFVHGKRGRNRDSGIITVLTSIDRIVEELFIHTGPIRYLLWGNEGRVLGSASADENLCLWDFFGTNQDLPKQKSKKVNDRKLDASDIFRSYIR